ncbi:BgTH12-06321 [Blumeria graminis f. sp. triticale]|uniref:BgTH12-06321 n=1 Tax=Blumeria graminis f. sp. triticale TaxID=1689686 RepID=A0A9W4CY37_BLUGR|nr:BgTH12-06321 [Blumeria graminis f. sp. triticale]
MAAAVLQPQRPSFEIMAPSPISPKASRHGRSRHGGSISKNNKTRGRGYSVIDERETLIAKAILRLLKRTVEEDEEQEKEKEEEEVVVPDLDGWFGVDAILAHSSLAAFRATLPELKAIASASKARFALKLKPHTITSEAQPIAPKEENEIPEELRAPINELVVPEKEYPASAYLIRSIQSNNVAQITPLSLKSNEIPDLIFYETTYANYPLILASGGIKRAGGQSYLSFKTITLSNGSDLPPVTADISIYIDLRSAMESNSEIEWSQSESGSVLTKGDDEGMVSKAMWKNVVARRADIGIIFENGEVKKDLLAGPRGKGSKPKKSGKTRSKNIEEMESCSVDKETPSISNK